MKRLLFIILVFPLLAGVSPFKGPTDLGNEAYGKGSYDEALRNYKGAVEASPDSPEAHYNLGNAYYKTGKYENALREYSEAARLDPEMADAHYNAGDSLFKMKMYEDALKSYGRAKGAYPDTDPDTEHNIEVTRKLVERQRKQQEQKERDKSNGEKDKEKGAQKPGKGQGQGQAGQGGEQKAAPGPPRMSNEELQALLERQASQEKRLRNYFRPGEKDSGPGREDELEQMLRGMGFGPMERRPRPGEPYVERDW